MFACGRAGTILTMVTLCGFPCISGLNEITPVKIRCIKINSHISRMPKHDILRHYVKKNRQKLREILNHEK